MPMLYLKGKYDTTANFISRAAGRLTGKIIAYAVNNYGFTKDIPKMKALVIECRPTIAIVAKQWGKVACMKRMYGIFGVVVFSRLVKGRGAITVLMNVHTIKAREKQFFGKNIFSGILGIIIGGSGGTLNVRKAPYFHIYDDTSKWHIIEISMPA